MRSFKPLDPASSIPTKNLVSAEAIKYINQSNRKSITFEANFQINRNIDSQLLMRLNDIQPSKKRTLVISRTSAQKTSFRVFDQFPWIVVPSIFLKGLQKKSN